MAVKQQWWQCLIIIFCAACAAPHAFVSGIVNEPVHQVRTDGRIQTLPTNLNINPTGTTIVGLAYSHKNDRLFARLQEGASTVVKEYVRTTGQLVRSITVQGISSGRACGMFEVLLVCGLAVRESDGHFFLDSPEVPVRIIEVDSNGNFVRQVPYNGPNNVAVTGLGFDQNSNRLFVLHADGTVTGQNVLASTFGVVSIQIPIGAAGVQPQGMDIDSENDQIAIPCASASSAICLYDFAGNKVREVPVARSVGGFLGGGVAHGKLRGTIW